MYSAGGVKTEVALKVLHTDIDGSHQAVQRLRDEGRVLGALVHPSILRVYDLVVLEGRVALITEYIEGQDLSKSIRIDGIPLRPLLETIGRVADALEAAWNAPAPGGRGALKLVHRDVKPANIRIGRHGEIKLLDFGVARADNVEREAQTGTGALVGSYLYMAPERFLDGTADAPGDVFGLGCCMYEGIAQRRFYKEFSLREVYKLALDEGRFGAHLDEQIAAVKHDCPDNVQTLLREVLSFSPDKRLNARALSRRCDESADLLPEASLRAWCRDRAWPAPNFVEGVLAGRVITETTVGHDQLPRPDWDDGFGATVLATRADSDAATIVHSSSQTRENEPKPDVLDGEPPGARSDSSLVNAGSPLVDAPSKDGNAKPSAPRGEVVASKPVPPKAPPKASHPPRVPQLATEPQPRSPWLWLAGVLGVTGASLLLFLTATAAGSALVWWFVL